MTAPLLAAHGLSKTFATASRRVVALDGVSLSVARGETLGLVGPSGCGKSTLARVLLRLTEPDEGRIDFAGIDFSALNGEALRRMRPRIQMVFQDPLSAFNPRATIAEAVGDPLRIHGLVPPRERPAAVAALLERVGLDPELAGRPVHAVSGGQRQRAALARALATQPALIVLDEAVSALDVAVRGRILDLVVSLQRERGIACLFISHDLAVVRAVSHRIAVMEAGRIVEEGPAGQVVAAPRSATARALVEATPRFVPDGGAGD